MSLSDSAVQSPKPLSTAQREETGGDARLEAGLDALSVESNQRESLVDRLRTKAVPPLVAVVVLVGAWQAFVATGYKRRDVVPGPADVWKRTVELFQDGTVTEALHGSLQRGAIGFLLSVVIGTVIGLVVAQSAFVRAAFGPLLSGLQVLPSVAWVPAAIIWFGTTEKAMMAVVLLGAVPSIANGLISGIDHVPPIYTRVGHVLGARGLTAVRHVVLPAALPGYFAGLKQGWAFSWRSLMAAELIVSSNAIRLGLGQYLDQGRTLSDMPMVMSGVLLILVVGIAVELLLFAPIERRIRRNRGLLAGSR